MTAAKIQDVRRTIVGIRENEEFYNRLYNRLDAVVDRYINGKFTIILTALPRARSKQVKRFNPELIYRGIKAQRNLLEGRFFNDLSLEVDWTNLDSMAHPLKEMRVSNELFQRFEQINSSDITDYVFPGELAEYFSDPSEFTEYQKHEFPILRRYFDIEKDRFISIPLIQFGEIDGIVHVIYTDKGYASLFDQQSGELKRNIIGDIIVGFSNEYEEIISDWHLSFGSLDFTEQFPLAVDRVGKAFLDDKKTVPNPVYEHFWKYEANNILKILEYQSYYTIHYPYFISKIEQHQRFLTDYYTHVLRQGVITVLLDSYAHNISAHALTTLSWIYSKRSTLYARRKTLDMIRQLGYGSNRFNDIDEYKGAYEELINLKEPIPLELYPLFKFLQEKGGFWSGLTRDLNPGGLTTDFFSILWDDFASNTLYLGTIVESEDIRKIHVHITLYESENPNDGYIVSPKVEYEGRLATISLESKVQHEYDPDVDDCYVSIEKNDTKENLWYRHHPELEPLSRYVQPGGSFSEFKTRLRAHRVFLPGGVVGKQALYNILENELRNIKHFSGDELSRAKKEGLTLNISIQPASLDARQRGEMYRLGVWLGLQAPLQIVTNKNGKRKQTSYLIRRRFKSLWEDIIDSENNFQPRLSGNNQDKVCAAMLFNSRFSSVQDGSRVWVGLVIGHPERDKNFYPWITPAVTLADGKTEFQIKPPGKYYDIRKNTDWFKVLKQGVKEYKQSVTDETPLGLLKKYFYVWKGHDVLPDATQDSDWDNSARFRIVYSPGDADYRAELRRRGILRVLPFAARDTDLHQDSHRPPHQQQQETLFEAYKDWLKYWLTEDKIVMSFFPETEKARNEASSLLIFDKNSPDVIQYYTTKKLSDNTEFTISKKISNAELEELRAAQSNCIELEYAHASGSNSPTALLFRKHGVMNRYFTPLNRSIDDLNLHDMPADRLAEWFEMMVAKICVIDNRIMHRMRLTGRDPDHFKNNVQVLFCSEDKQESPDSSHWTSVWEDGTTQQFVKKAHFLILHLSFIENVLQNKYNNFSRDVGFFVQHELLPLWEGKLPHNFVLTVTSGRGNNTWWEDLRKNEDYKIFLPHIIFRPIESLLSAVEGGAIQKDDFELKYRFIKILFGS